MRAPAGRNMFRPGRRHMCRRQLQNGGQFLPRALEFLERGRLEHHLQIEDPLFEPVQLVGADDRVARHARLPGPRRHFGERLARETLAVKPSLAGDDRARGAQPLVEAECLQHSDRPGSQLGTESRPQPPGKPAGRRRS